MRRPRSALLITLLLPPSLLLTAAAPASPPNDAAHYLDQFIDRSADPRNDFWEFSVGKWLKAHPIPGNEAGWGIGNVIQDETYARLRTLNESAGASRPAHGTSAQKIADFWRTAMDTVTIAKQGLTPIADE